MKTVHFLMALAILLTLRGNTKTALPDGFCDRFNGSSLDSGWAWVDPLGDSNFSLTANPGYLRLSTPDGGHDLYPAANFNAPRLVQPISGDFVITTKVTINPTFNYQGAGLLIWQDEDNYLRLERTLVDGIDVWYRIAGVYNGIEIHFSNPTVYLRFQRSGTSFTGTYSEDGSTWATAATLDFAAAGSLQAGLVLINQWQDHPIFADFDYFDVNGCSTTGVPFFWQRYPPWADHPLLSDGECTLNTIGTGGCTLTSAAMVFKYYGANQTTTGSEMNPPDLSDCMARKACPFQWLVGASCANSKAAWLSGGMWNDASGWGILENQMKQSHPVILGMHKGSNTHWVVVTSGYGSDPLNYTINDPWYPGGRGMNLYQARISHGWVLDSFAVYGGQPGNGQLKSASEIDTSVTPLPGMVTELDGARVPSSSGGIRAGQSSVISGTVLVYGVTDVTMTLELSAQSTAGPITQMHIWSDSDTNTPWQTYSTFASMPYSDYVYAEFRDSTDNVSGVSSDTNIPGAPPPPPFPTQVFLPVTLNQH